MLFLKLLNLMLKSLFLDCSLLPQPMMELYMPEMLHKSYLPLLEKCEEKFEAIHHYPYILARREPYTFL